MKKKLKHRKDYKTETGYLNYLWRINKDRIQEATPDVDKKIFKARVREMMDEMSSKKGRKRKPTHAEAVDKLLRTEEYLSKADRLAENAIEGIRADKSAFEQFRKMTGWKEKIDPSKMHWDSKERMYYYEGLYGKVWIDYSNSPEGIMFRKSERVNPVTGKTITRTRKETFITQEGKKLN